MNPLQMAHYRVKERHTSDAAQFDISPILARI